MRVSQTLSTLLILFLAGSAMAAGRDLEAPVPGATGFSVGLSATAFAGDRFLTVWEPFSGNQFLGSLSDANGKRLSTVSFPILKTARVRVMALVGTDAGYALFWRDGFDVLHHAELSPEGALIRTSRLPVKMRWPRAAWNGTHLLLVGAETASSIAEALLLSREGVVLRRTPFPQQTDPLDIITLPDSSFFVTTSGGGALRGLNFSPMGEVAANIVIEPEHRFSFEGASIAAVAMTDGRVMVAYAFGLFAQLQELRVAIVSASGVSNRSLLVPARDYYAIDAVHLVSRDSGFTVYFRGTTAYVAGIQHLDTVAIMLDAEGRPTSAQAITLDRATRQSALAFTSTASVTLMVRSDTSLIVGTALVWPSWELRPEALSVAPSLQSEVRIGANATGFAAVWNDSAGGNYAVHAAGVDGNGDRLSPVTHFPGRLASRQLASGPSEHLFARYTGTELIATRIAANGSALHDLQLMSGQNPQAAAEAVWTGSGFLVAWTNGQQVFTTFAAGNSTPSIRPVNFEPLAPQQVRQTSNLRLAFDGQTALLLWDEAIRLGCQIPGYCTDVSAQVMAIRLSPGGEPQDSTPSVLTTQLSPLLAGGPGRFLLYSKQDRGARVIIAGQSGIQMGEAATLIIGSYTVSDIVSSGNGYKAAVTTAGRYVGTVPLDASGRATAAVRAAAADGWVSSVRIASFNGDAVVAGSVFDGLSSARARTFREPELHPVPSPPAETIIGVNADERGITTIRWQPVEGADGYVIDVFISGGQVATLIADADATSIETVYPSTAEYRVRPFNAGGFFAPVVNPRRRSARP